MIKWLVVISVVFLLRVAGARARLPSHRPLLRALSWIACMSAGWLAVRNIGSWSPYSLVLILALVAALADSSDQRVRYELWLVGDVAIVLLTGLLSIPPIPLPSLILLALVLVLFGHLIDRLVVLRFLSNSLVTFWFPFTLAIGARSLLIMWAPAGVVTRLLFAIPVV